MSSRWDIFWYDKNAEGDILGIYDEFGNLLISYTYDSWGNHSVSYHNGTTASSPAAKNPFRYRSYYYDSDLDLYYLNSRYYDAKVKRFINSDGYVSTGQGFLGYNMFAYCNNNPVLYYDPEGTDAIYVVAFDEKDGLPIFGHAQLYYQDDCGEWWFTEYTGPTPSRAKVYNYKTNLSTEEILNRLKKSTYYEYVYIEGDFSRAGAYAEKHKWTNYGGYHFTKNNCLHYVHDTLNYAAYYNCEELYQEMKTIVPCLYYPTQFPVYEKAVDNKNRVQLLK